MIRVFVYFNLHKRCWSVKALEGSEKGRVIAHTDSLSLKSCRFVVQAAGLARVRKEKRKNVHAGVVGLWDMKDFKGRISPKWKEVTYNPFKYDTFVDLKTKEEVAESTRVVLRSKRVWRE